MWPIPSASQAENSPWVGSSSAPRSNSPTHCSLQLLAFLAELLILSSQPFFCKKWLIFSMNSFLSLFYDYKKLATQRPMFILNCSHSSSKLWVFSLIQLSWKLHGFPMIWLRFTTVESGLTLLPLSSSISPSPFPHCLSLRFIEAIWWLRGSTITTLNLSDVLTKGLTETSLISSLASRSHLT